MSHPLYTVGHSNSDRATFLALLRRAGVTAVADVRSAPYSRRHPQFNRPELERALRECGIAYVFLGDCLGGRPADRALYDDGIVDYARVRATAAFQEGLDRLQRGSEMYTIALLCGERDPLDCHRGLMVAPALADRGAAPGHLRPDGSVESHADLERRLVALTGVGVGELDGLFAGQLSDAERRALLDLAYRTRARKIAYRLADAADEAGEDPLP